MRIAFIVNQFPVLSETFILNQITGSIERGHEVDIYAHRPKDTAKIHPDVESYHLLDRTYYFTDIPHNRCLRVVKAIGLSFANCTKAPVSLRSLNIFKYGKQIVLLQYAVHLFLQGQACYDIVHCHFGPNGLKASLLIDIGVLRGKLITTFYGYDISSYVQQFGDRIYDSLFELGDLFLPISEHMKDQLIKLGCACQKIAVHRLGIDCERFYFAPSQLPTNRPVGILTIARLVEKKGVEYGIRAVAKLLQTNPQIEYNIIGDGLLKESLKQLIQELSVGNAVKLLGWKQQEEVVEILNHTDILLAPSVTSEDGDREGTPVVLMEAMARGLPIVSTQHSGIPELIENGVSGFLVPERDVEALAEKLGYLLEHPELWSEMGRAGRDRVEQCYDINKLSDRLVEIYQQLVSGDDVLISAGQSVEMSSDITRLS